MELNAVRLGRIAVVSVAGDVDAKDADVLRTTFQRFRHREIRHFLVDLLELRFICSAGLRSLLELRKELHEIGGELRVVRPDTKAFEIFTASHLDGVFDFYSLHSTPLLGWLVPPSHKLTPVDEHQPELPR